MSHPYLTAERGNLGKEIDERTATEQLLSKKPSKGSKEEALVGC